MGKPDVNIAKNVWPAERKLINRIITKQKGYHNKPYPAKNKIPTEALHSITGALDVLDKAEKKKANKGYIRSYRKTHEWTKGSLPEAHYMAFKKKQKKNKTKQKVVKDSSYKPSAATIKRKAETKEERSARLQASLAAARRNFVAPSEFGGGPMDLQSVIKQHLGPSIPKNYFS